MRPMMLVLSLVLGVIPLFGIAWILLNGMIRLWPPAATVDGLFMSLILLTLSGCFMLNAYWEARDRGLLNFLHKKVVATPATAAKPPAPKAS